MLAVILVIVVGTIRLVGCGSPKLDRPDHIDFSTAWKEQSGNMLVILLGLFQLIWLFGRGL
jgi:hypothetical protein